MSDRQLLEAIGWMIVAVSFMSMALWWRVSDQLALIEAEVTKGNRLLTVWCETWGQPAEDVRAKLYKILETMK